MKAPGGGSVWPCVLSPQQTAVPSPRRAQVWFAPAATWVYAPGGGEACPCCFSPQQINDPSSRTAQACAYPALTDCTGRLLSANSMSSRANWFNTTGRKKALLESSALKKKKKKDRPF